MDENGYVPPYPRRRSSCLSRVLSLPILMAVLPVILMVLLFFVVPPFLSLTARIFVPETVKLSWDLFSVLLVLFAILSGVLGKRIDGAVAPPVARRRRVEGGERHGLRRIGGSFPDLRREAAREAPECEEWFRCSDDFEINRHSSPECGRIVRRSGSGIGESSDDAKVIPVDTCVLRSSSPPPSPPPDSPARPVPFPPPDSPPTVFQKAEQTYDSVRSPEKPVAVSQIDDEVGKISSPATTQPPPPAAVVLRVENSDQKQKLGKFERRTSIAKKEIAMVLQLANLYSQRKRIKAKTVRENASDSPPRATVTHFSTTLPPPSPAPPPPPLPPPPSVFHSLFKKGMIKKNWKKIHSLPPPPPPPPSSTTQIQPPPVPAPPPKSSRRRNSSTSGKPPLIPFRTATVVKEDFDRIKSTQSLHCSALASGAVDQPSSASDGGDAVGSVFCPSPDVNVKADTFIARLKDGWRLEKMNSVREKKDVGLGPETGPGP